MQTKAKKWGNSLGIRVPRAIADAADIHDETPVEVLYREDDDEIIIRRVHRKTKYTLEELLAKMPRNSEESHGETDWGKPEGDEVW